jgi:hypothetical protein
MWRLLWYSARLLLLELLVVPVAVRGKHIRGLHVLFGTSEKQGRRARANICSAEKLAKEAERPFFSACMANGGGYRNAAGEFRGCTPCWKQLSLRDKYKVLGADWESAEQAKPSGKPTKIPNIIHFIWLKGAFEWTAYLAIEAAYQRLKPDKIFMHCLDGLPPAGPW